VAGTGQILMATGTSQNLVSYAIGTEQGEARPTATTTSPTYVAYLAFAIR
ncbi:MAG: hypothetical protein H7X97_01420, partial [Opitutaceae bacterium]|nr:hypothetical protein [Verrucomicrobiales bacterium]